MKEKITAFIKENHLEDTILGNRTCQILMLISALFFSVGIICAFLTFVVHYKAAFVFSMLWLFSWAFHWLVSMFIFVYWKKQESKKEEQKHKKYMEERRKQYEEKREKYNQWLDANYNINKIIDYVDYNLNRTVVAFDITKKVILFDLKEVAFNKIIDVEMLTEKTVQTTTTCTKKNAAGRALMGGLVGGEVGAVIGAATAKEIERSESVEKTQIKGIRIYFSSINNPSMDFMVYQYDRNFVEELYRTLVAVTKRRK